ncbi:STAS/SEC14 domain-containing protein [Roseofilum sp. Guam]|uniref:STAS/SEC14 domain-containing protein n=1 Tax=Roseofilum sp. Guam TaxID=2821502 RepID=UPI001B0FBAA7|nr:STAS/SEC14 domain-containing protein [Roseofilum sp. Guam]MBP0028846.1 STAS/SEC14 domain-containing protein [Roseofilum sp. Guam]
MLTLIALDRPSVVAMSIEGKIEREDIEKISQAIEEKLQHSPHLQAYVEVKQLGWITPDALLEDLKIGFNHFKDFDKKAVVCDAKWINSLLPLARRLFPSLEVACFGWSEQEQARQWILKE